MQPSVAITLVELGLSLKGVRTALSLERGMELLRATELESDSGNGAQRLTGSPLNGSEDIVNVRQAVRSRAVEMGFSLVDQTKIVTAASEIARNTVIYGGGGWAELRILNRGDRKGLQIVFEDQGPGIADIDKALQDGLHHGRRPRSWAWAAPRGW